MASSTTSKSVLATMPISHVDNLLQASSNVCVASAVDDPSITATPPLPNNHFGKENRKRKTAISGVEDTPKPRKRARISRKDPGKIATEPAKHEKSVSRRSKGKASSEHDHDSSASQIVPVILPPLAHRVMDKIRAMRTYISIVDEQAGITYVTIDSYGLGDPTQTCLPANDFLAALKILAADLDLEPPDLIDLSRGADMIDRVEQSILPSGVVFQWAIVDFTKSNDIEARAQALIGNRGFQGRSLLGIECCMRAWHQAQLTTARLPGPGFRSASNARLPNGNAGAWTGATSRDTQKQPSQDRVAEPLTCNQDAANAYNDLDECQDVKVDSDIFTVRASPWLQLARREDADIPGEEQISPRTITTCRQG